MTRKSCPIQELLLQLLAPYPCNYYHGQRATKVRKSPLLLPTPQPHYLLQSAAPNGCPIHCFPPSTSSHSPITVSVSRSCRNMASVSSPSPDSLLSTYVWLKLEHIWKPSCKGVWEIPSSPFQPLQDRKALWKEVRIDAKHQSSIFTTA